MDHYDIFKVLLSEKLNGFLDSNIVKEIIVCLDNVSRDFSITQHETNQSVIEDCMPAPLKFFLAAKTVEEKSPKTINLYRCILSNFFISVKKSICEISTNDIRDYLSLCKQSGNKSVTVGNIRRVLSSFFEWCVLECYVTANPVKRISAIKTEKSPRKSMKRIELEYLRNACSSPRDKALVDFLYSTGVRVSEFCNARIDNIDWEKKAVLIEHGKGDVTRWTYFNPECEVSLRAYLETRHDDSPFIFAPARGQSTEAIAPRTVQSAIDRIAMKSGKRFSVKISPHIFRHTIATVLLHNGMPVEQVQRFLGHANINTTMIYAEVRDEDVRHTHSMYAA